MYSLVSPDSCQASKLVGGVTHARLMMCDRCCCVVLWLRGLYLLGPARSPFETTTDAKV